ncbi:MAG: fumarylacetoacetate hydrolase family protein, partial [Gammaproteobacteria bacterium]|nr:fumarylacetoacetate hydrolase family protein [Gammaproteobacteria bacterium]
MKVLTCSYRGRQRLGVALDDHAVLPSLDPAGHAPPDDMLELIRAGRVGLESLRRFADEASDACRVAMDELRLLAPVPKPPSNVICLGWNYVEHIEESAGAKVHDSKLPDHPVVFTKAVGSVTGPFDPVPFDDGFSTEMDWEVELGVVIGRRGRKIAKADALDHVFGYTVINDISIRDVQFRHQQFFLGKSADGCCPMGPHIVTADEIDDPQDLDLRCRVNGDVKQSSNTRYMIFDIAETIAILSKGMTLNPGDIIATGTPSGVGFARKPPEFLKPG